MARHNWACKVLGENIVDTRNKEIFAKAKECWCYKPKPRSVRTKVKKK